MEEEKDKKGFTGRYFGSKTIPILGELESRTKEGITVATGTIYDYAKEKFQQTINEEYGQQIESLNNSFSEVVQDDIIPRLAEAEEKVDNNIPYIIVYENQYVNIPCDTYGNCLDDSSNIETKVKLYHGNIVENLAETNGIIVDSQGSEYQYILDEQSGDNSFASLSILGSNVKFLQDLTEVDFHLVGESETIVYGKIFFNKVKQGKSAFEEWKDLHPEIENPTPARFISDLKNVDGVYGPKYAPNETAAIADADGATVIYFIPNDEDTTKYDIILVEDGEAKPLAQEVSGDITNYAGIYDVSEDNLDISNNPSKYSTLSDAIDDIAETAKKGGMTIKYIDSESGKYVQYRYVSTSIAGTDFENEENWIAENDLAESVLEHDDILENCYQHSGENVVTNKSFSTADMVFADTRHNLTPSNSRLVLDKYKLIPIHGAYKIVATFPTDAVTQAAVNVSMKGGVAIYDVNRERIAIETSAFVGTEERVFTTNLESDAYYISPYFLANDISQAISKDWIDTSKITIEVYTKEKETLKAASEQFVSSVKIELEQKIDEHSPIVVKKPVSAQFNPYFISTTNPLLYKRARFYHEIRKNTNIRIVKANQNSSFLYQINVHKFVDEAGEGNDYRTNDGHCYYTQIVKSWSEVQQDGNANIDFSSDDWDWFTIQLKIGDDGSDVITESDIDDFLEDYSIEIKENANDVESIEDATKTYKLYALSYKVSTLKVGNTDTPQGEVVTEFLAKPKENLSLKIKLPIWMKVRLAKGLRGQSGSNDRNETSYHYNGDTITLINLDGGVRFELSSVMAYGNSGLRSESSVSVGDCLQLIKDGAISFTYMDDDCDDILIRNYDAEKYLGAIRTTVPLNETIPNLTSIVHVSDIHGDAIRFDSACKFASHIGADIVINTGDDKYMWLNDGSGFVKDVLDKYPNLDYANCIGNHDTYIESGYYGGISNVSEIYAASIAPFVTPYNYVLGDTGKRYYHKDLASKSIRIIALDLYDGFTVNGNLKARISKAQIDWFIATLASTPNGYGVIVILHQVPHKNVSIIEDKTNFNDATMSPRFAAIDDEVYMTAGTISGNPIAKIIDAFIGKTNVSGSYTQKNAAGSTNETITYEANFSNDVNSGVEFIAYLNGHTHRDWAGTIGDCTHRQVNINVCSTSGISQSTGLPATSDIFRGLSGSTQDALNVYTINRIDKTIGICRIGSNLSKDLRDRKVMFVKYVDDEV